MPPTHPPTPLPPAPPMAGSSANNTAHPPHRRASSPTPSSCSTSPPPPPLAPSPLPTSRRHRPPLLLSPPSSRSSILMHHHHPSRSYSSNSSSSDESSWSSSESGSSLGRGSRRTSTTTVSSDTSDDDNEVSDDSPKAGPSRTTVEIATEEEQEEENVPRGEPNEFCRGVERQTGHQSSSSSTRPLRTLSLSVQSGEDDEEWKLKELSTIKTTRRGLSDPPWKARAPLSSQQEPLLPLHVRPKLTSPTLDPPPQQLKLLDALQNALLRSTPSFEPPSALLDGPTLPSSSSPSPSITSKNTPLLQLLHPRWSTSSSSSHTRSTRTPTCASQTPTSPTTTRKLLRSAALILRSVLTYFAVSVACLWLAGDVYYYLGFLLGFRSTAYKAAFWAIVGLACCGFQYAGFWMIVHLGRQLAVLWQLDLQKYERSLAGVLRRWRFVSPSPELVGSPLEEGTRGWGRGREREGVV